MAHLTTQMKSVCGRAEGDILDHQLFADTLKKIGFKGDVITIEVFRPEYYEMTQEDNVKKLQKLLKLMSRNISAIDVGVLLALI